VPYTPEEAEVARALELTVEKGRVKRLRWIVRAQIAADATRRPLLELGAAPEKGARLELSTTDAVHVADAAPLLATDGTIVVEVPGAWESARLLTRDEAVTARDP
jgi:hypothetical protein